GARGAESAARVRHPRGGSRRDGRPRARATASRGGAPSTRRSTWTAPRGASLHPPGSPPVHLRHDPGITPEDVALEAPDLETGLANERVDPAVDVAAARNPSLEGVEEVLAAGNALVVAASVLEEHVRPLGFQ